MTHPSQPIQVTMVSPAGIEHPDGGITQLLSYFIRGIQGDDRIDVDVYVTRARSGSIAKHLSSLNRLLQFRRHLRRRQTQIVHLHVAPRGSTWRKMLFATVAKRAGCKIVLHLHGSGYDKFYEGQPAFLRARIRGFFRAADGVIALGEQWRAFVADILGVAQHQIHAINNGVPVEQADAEACAPAKPPVILFAGAVGQRKGVDTLIESLGKLPSKNWRCDICGDGDLEHYKDLRRRHGLTEDEVRFVGWQSEADLRRRMCQAYMFVLPSRAENQPVAIIEAMAYGLPAISTNIGDIPNQVIDGETGFIVEPTDARSLTDRIHRILEDFHLRTRMGQAGRRRFEQEFSLVQNIDKTIEVYRNLAE